MTSQFSKIFVQNGNMVHLVNVDDIIQCEGASNYTNIYTRDGNKISSCKTLKKYQKILEKHSFIRVNRSHLLNPVHIKGIERNTVTSKGKIVMTNEMNIPLSSATYRMVIDKIRVHQSIIIG